MEGLTEEQIEKLRNCKDSKEALQLAKEEGIKLTEEQLDVILSYENVARKKLGIQTGGYQYEIRPDKKFDHGYYFPLIQAGLSLSPEEMIQRMNHYMAEHLG